MNDDDGDGLRTQLAVERTTLAWWRTAFAALAVALAVGRLLPDLAPDVTSWPYVLLGLGFAVYAIALMVYGSVRHATAGGRVPPAMLLATAVGVLLGLATAVLIAAG